jgi:hypothetical protein
MMLDEMCYDSKARPIRERKNARNPHTPRNARTGHIPAQPSKRWSKSRLIRARRPVCATGPLQLCAIAVFRVTTPLVTE